jgi:hypothetical protein
MGRTGGRREGERAASVLLVGCRCSCAPPPLPPGGRCGCRPPPHPPSTRGQMWLQTLSSPPFHPGADVAADPLLTPLPPGGQMWLQTPSSPPFHPGADVAADPLLTRILLRQLPHHALVDDLIFSSLRRPLCGCSGRSTQSVPRRRQPAQRGPVGLPATQREARPLPTYANTQRHSKGGGMRHICAPDPSNYTTTQPCNHTTTQPCNHTTTQPCSHTTTRAPK